jgi:hypothetical protein
VSPPTNNRARRINAINSVKVQLIASAIPSLAASAARTNSSSPGP